MQEIYGGSFHVNGWLALKMEKRQQQEGLVIVIAV